jgi:hypothetical protein
MNIYYTRYHKIVNHFLINPPTSGEYHHIVPKCLGGSDEKSNLVLLPAKAHFLVHHILCKMYPSNRRLKHAFAMMAVNNPYQDRIISSRLYDAAKKSRSEALKGVPRSEEVKVKLRKPKANKENYKKPKSEDHRKSMSMAQKGRTHPIKTCSHCGKSGIAPNISRWHEDNCKQRHCYSATSTMNL